MNRCLHITHEHPGALPRRGGTYLRRWTGTDPESNTAMPDPDDPESNSAMPDPDDPESNSAMPDPDDPRYHYFPSFGPGGCGAAVATACSCCCAAPACQGTSEDAAPHPYVRPRDYSGFVIVRMARGIEHPQARSLWRLAKRHEPELTGLKTALVIPDDAGTAGARRWRCAWRPRHFVSRPLIELPRMTRDIELEMIRRLEMTAATSPFRPRYSLTSYWRLDLREHPGLVEDVVARLNRLAEVDLAYRELAAVDSQTVAIDGCDFAEDQGYLADAPMGIGAAHLPPTSSQTLVLCDLEQGWNLGHVDLPSSAVAIGDNRADDELGAGQHGTAVLGQLVALGTSSLGVKGAAAGLGRHVLASHYKARTSGHPFAGTNGHVTEAIVRALVGSSPLGAGDVLLLEVQRGLLPTEVDEADFDAIRLAAGRGVIVIEAAGNGGFDLDLYSDPDIRRSLRRGAPDFRDSGAILVGASRASLPHDRAPFSNYGSRLDCFGWGETVTTCGYGDLAGTGDTDFYTNSFSGTSSASPIIAGAAALLQALHEANAGARLGPQAMRTLLADPATGTRQGPNVAGHIGVMPDLRAIVRDRLQLVPDVYLRRSIGGGGSAAGPQDEISSSPDILVWAGSGTPDARFGEGSGRENLPAPGHPFVAGPANNVYLRLRNRGLGKGAVDVQLFASPAATLITPERWIPVGGLPSTPQGIVPQGDTLFVAGPAAITLHTATQPTLWSLLAVLGPSGGLPPGPPYFDWEEYLSFLRQPGVAWRNAHRISETNPVIPSFCIAGTPDRARRFDLEVIQRLPAGATVTLQVPGALAAKLRQRQPWLKGAGSVLHLPQRPRTAICGVQLAAGARADATFTVTAGSSLARGHSLAIRQLWRGEEVGRITWFFGLDP